MKPTKNRFYCKDAGKQKILFETEKKADTFIKFNSDDIESESGYSPNRSYYCIFCDGWHVTSKKENINIKSKTEKILELYNEEKEKKAAMITKNAEIRNMKSDELIKCLEAIEKQIKVMEAIKESGDLNSCIQILNTTFAKLEIAKNFAGNNKRKNNAEEKLNKIKKEIEFH